MKKPMPIEKWILALVVAVVMLAIIGAFTRKPYVERPDMYIPTEFDAYIMAKHFMTESLKAPSTAEFASRHKSVIRLLERDKLKVSSFVDAQNSFGAMLRTHFTIVMTVDRETQKWVVTSLEME